MNNVSSNVLQISLFLRYFYIKRGQLSIFFLFKGKRHVWMTIIKIDKLPDFFKSLQIIVDIFFMVN